MMKKEEMLAITMVKIIAFNYLCIESEDKGLEKKLYRLAKTRDERVKDLDQMKCKKDKDDKKTSGGYTY